MKNPRLQLKIAEAGGGQVRETALATWHLELPTGPRSRYRLAQLDDYHAVPRSRFPWHPPFRLSLRGRASAQDLPGTWGFGLWNDPFSLSLGLGGASQRFPALPNAAWFFYASPPNYLSFRNDLPAQGFLAATFRSPKLPAPLLALASPLLAPAVLPIGAQLIRWLLRQIIHQDAALIQADVIAWHTYTLDWQPQQVTLSIDGLFILTTPIVPHPPLSLVIWIDNQFAALPPKGRLSYGALPNPEPAWIEVELIALTQPP